VSSSDVVDLTLRLAELPGVAGDEAAVRAAIWDEVGAAVDAGRIDALGNLIVRRGRGGPRVLLDAHMDEVGLMVQRIDKDGLLRFAAVGGLDPRVLPGTLVQVGPQGVPGVIGWKPLHLQDDADRKRVVPIKDLAIDIGASSREQAERAVRPGDYAVFATRAGRFGEGLIRGKALDDRVGCAVLATLLHDDYGCEVNGVFAVQEEIGLRGAGVAAHAVAPDLAVALEGTTCADVAGVDPHAQATRLGGGPVLTVMDGGLIADRRVNELLATAAAEAGVAYQWKRTAAGGTDAGRIHLTRGGVPSAVVSVPCRYIHAPCAVAAEADMRAAVRLLQAFLRIVARRGFVAA
jgi:putative aminopeptidase FrvX